MATFKIVTLAEVQAAGGNWSPSAYLSEPCGNCPHGKAQHHPLPSVHSSQRVKDSTRCTSPGCDCTEYTRRQVFYGS